MAPIKLEDNIREKLEERKIQPSSGAWDKLATQLNNAKGEKKSNKIVWYAVAASLVSALIVASLVFNRTNNTSNDTEFVEVNTSEGDKNEKNELAIPKLQASEEKNDDGIASEANKTPIKKNEIVNNSEKANHPKNDMVNKVTEAVITTQAVVKNDLPAQNEVQKPIKKADIILNNKVNEVIAQVEELEANNTPISMEEIDALLASAQREIKTQPVLDSKKVDPTALLGDVEWELEKSFRDKVYVALSDGYDIIKTAVVERNN